MRGWNLILTVPKSADSHGQVMIDCGGDFRPKISLTKLVHGSQPYPANPESSDYGSIWASPEVRPEYRAAVMQRIPGLKTGKVTAFATGAQKYKARVESLSWATSYYFVWRRDGHFALPAEIPSHLLADRASWCCALVSLPGEADSALLNWLQDSCGLHLAHEKRKWSIIYPVAYDVDVGGRIQLPPTPNVLVAAFTPGDANDHESSLECTAGDLRASAVARPGGWQFFELTANEAAIGSVLALKWDHTPLPELARLPLPVAPSPAVVLGFRARKDGALSRVALHHASCPRALRRVRASEADISAVQLPSAIAGEFRWRPADEIQWESLAFDNVATRDAHGVYLSADLVSAINRRLQDRTLEALLSFGPFGAFHSEIEAPAPIAADKPRLQSTTRATVLWFCKTSRAYRTITRKPIDALDDDGLLAHFATITAATWLVAHKRSIERKLGGRHASKVHDE